MGRKGYERDLKEFILGTALIIVSLVLLSSPPVEGRPKEAAADGDKSKTANPSLSTAPPPTSTAARVTDPPMPTEARRERDEELDDDEDDREMAIPLCTRFTGTITPTTPTTVETTTQRAAVPLADGGAPAGGTAGGASNAEAANDPNKASVRQKIDDYQEELMNMMEELRAVPPPAVPPGDAPARDPTGGAAMPLLPPVENSVLDSGNYRRASDEPGSINLTTVRIPKGRRPKLGRHRHPYNQPNRYRNRAHPYETSAQRRKWTYPLVDEPAAPVGAPAAPIAPGMAARPGYGYRRGGGGMRAKGFQASNHRVRSGAGRPGSIRSRQHMTRQGAIGGLGAQVLSQYEANVHKPRATMNGMIQRGRPLGRGLPPPDLDGIPGLNDAMPMID